MLKLSFKSSKHFQTKGYLLNNIPATMLSSGNWEGIFQALFLKVCPVGEQFLKMQWKKKKKKRNFKDKWIEGELSQVRLVSSVGCGLWDSEPVLDWYADVVENEMATHSSILA